jgi:hypothetical protein
MEAGIKAFPRGRRGEAYADMLVDALMIHISSRMNTVGAYMTSSSVSRN